MSRDRCEGCDPILLRSWLWLDGRHSDFGCVLGRVEGEEQRPRGGVGHVIMPVGSVINGVAAASTAV